MSGQLTNQWKPAISQTSFMAGCFSVGKSIFKLAADEPQASYGIWKCQQIRLFLEMNFKP